MPIFIRRPKSRLLSTTTYSFLLLSPLWFFFAYLLRFFYGPAIIAAFPASFLAMFFASSNNRVILAVCVLSAVLFYPLFRRVKQHFHRRFRYLSSLFAPFPPPFLSFHVVKGKVLYHRSTSFICSFVPFHDCNHAFFVFYMSPCRFSESFELYRILSCLSAFFFGFIVRLVLSYCFRILSILVCIFCFSLFPHSFCAFPVSKPSYFFECFVAP